jgi:hypothetical protein
MDFRILHDLGLTERYNGENRSEVAARMRLVNS